MKLAVLFLPLHVFIVAALLPAQDVETDFFAPHGVRGSFIMCVVDADSCFVIDEARCAQPFLPASTFKILNSLLALQHGAVNGIDDTLRWDGRRHSIASWNQDQCMRDAFQRSCVWFYQELARRIGAERMQAALNETSYGNRDMSGGIDRFWLDGALRITPLEQIAFLKKLWFESLPFDREVQKTVKNLMLLENGDGWVLRGKTGTATPNGKLIGWLVGFLETNDGVYAYALNIEKEDSGDLSAFWSMRQKIVMEIFRARKLI